MRRMVRSAVGAAILLVTATVAAEGQRPLREARSDNGQFLLRVDPGRPGRAGRDCRATLYRQSEGSRRGRPVWERALVNEAAPKVAAVRDDGRFVVTLDEYRRGGARHALVIYGAQGELLRHFLLMDLLDKSDWKHVQVKPRELIWLDDARFVFDDEAAQFVIELKWGRKIRIDLKTLQVVRDDDRARGERFAAIPTEVLTELLEHLGDDGERVIAERLAELVELSPEERAQADAITEQLSADEVAAADEGAAGAGGVDQAVAAAEERAPDGLGVVDEGPAAESASAEEEAGPVAMTEATGGNESEVERLEVEFPDPLEEDVVDSSPLTPIVVPAPDPVEKVDYVAWLNELGRVEGPDANPVYQEAITELVPWQGDPDLYRAAERGDPAALQSPEIAAWLASNADALATFREASQYPARGWDRQSEDGSMIAVLLPDLAQMRTLAKLSVMDGRRLATDGRPAAAAERYLDALASGAHVGEGLTLIENLVAVAVQTLASDALLDLQADPSADTLDYVELAAEVEAANRPPRSSAETIQAERAFFLDTAQRLWDVDPQSGEYVVNTDKAAEFFGYAIEDEAEVEARAAQAADADFEDTVTLGNAYYDALTEALSLPYPEASKHLNRLEAWLTSPEISNPVIRHMSPALSRYNFVKTRGETARQASLLVTNLRAYRQQHGEYPASLEVFGGREFAVDPFSNRPFVYRREGDDFVLYSLGGNGTDDAGVHDRRGQTNDVVFWPRPE